MDVRVAVPAIIVSIVVLVAIIIGLSVYYEIATVDELSVQTELFTGLVNTSDQTKTLDYPPLSTSEFSGTWYNKSSAAWSAMGAGLFTRTGATLVLKTNTGGNDGLNMSQVNVTYYTQAGVTMRDSVNPPAGSVFSLAPVIGLVLIAGVIMGMILLVSRGRKV